MEAKNLPSISAFSSVDTRLAVLVRQGGYAFFDLPFLIVISVEALLVILCNPCQIQLQLHLGPPDPILAQWGSVPILFPRYPSLLPLAVQFTLAL